MNTSASSTASVNSPTKGSKAIPRVYAGYGYRFLRAGEVITADTEVLLGDGQSTCRYYETREKVDPKRTVLEGPTGLRPAGIYRVPTPAPAGFRLLAADEITKEGDHYFSERFAGVLKGRDDVLKRLGQTAENAVVSVNKDNSWGIFEHGLVTAIIRKEEPKVENAKAKTKTIPQGWVKVLSGKIVKGDALVEEDGTLFDYAEGYAGKDIKELPHGCVHSVYRAPEAGLSLAALPTPDPLEVAQAEIKKLQGELKDARHGCKKLSEVVDRQRNKITELEAKLKDKDNRQDQAQAWEAVFGALCDRLPDVYTEVDTGKCGRDHAVDMVKFVQHKRAESSHKITELEAKLKDAEARITNIVEAYKEKSAQLERAQKGARGNVVIVRRDGFSKPMDISPVYGFNGPELPRCVRFFESTLGTFEAENTGKKDGFGRTIFAQA